MCSSICYCRQPSTAGRRRLLYIHTHPCIHIGFRPPDSGRVFRLCTRVVGRESPNGASHLHTRLHPNLPIFQSAICNLHSAFCVLHCTPAHPVLLRLPRAPLASIALPSGQIANRTSPPSSRPLESPRHQSRVSLNWQVNSLALCLCCPSFPHLRSHPIAWTVVTMAVTPSRVPPSGT